MRTITSLLVAGFLIAVSPASLATAQDKAGTNAGQAPSGAAAKDGTAAPAAAAPAKADAKPAPEAVKKADAKPVAEPAQKKPAPPKPEPTGLERLSSDWPKWLKVGVQYRGRVEALRPTTGNAPDYDGYYMNRLRLSGSVQAGKWVQVAAQIQDVAALGYGPSPVPTSVSGGFDLRTGYVEVGRKGPRGMTVAGGRMEYSLGDGRLIASPDWGNTSRTYDMGRVSAFLPGFKIDVFRAAPVLIDPAKFDRVKPGEYFWGTYATFDKIPGLTLVDLYAFQKANSVVTGESGKKGDARLYTYGGRVAGPLGKTVSYDAGAAIQRGHLAADDVEAWAAHAAVAWTMSKSAMKPKLSLEYAFASGDANAKDGVKQTFDQMYASNHAKYGLADLIGWRNMHTFAVKFDAALSKKVKLNAAVNRLLLARVTDNWYGSSGSKIVANAKATSRAVGWEPDVFTSVAISKEMTIGAGLAVLVPGDYVKQSASIDKYWYPYVMWTLKF
jgi:hypothetical protein